jgi:solute:Na+ symporter, SSS family
MVPFIVILPGLLGLALLPMKLVDEGTAVATGGHSFNEVLPLMLARYCGPGLLGLGVTALIAGFMSGMAGNVSAFATVWTYDVYKPLIRKTASDGHYLTMGRWASVIGVFVSIGTAYSLFWFSNILEFLQVLIFFFIVPLFGTVILGMLWKRASPAGGFWGFLVAIVFSISMWVWVHSFPEGYRPQPKATLAAGSVVTLHKIGTGRDEKTVGVRVVSGSVDLVNVASVAPGTATVAGELTLPPTSATKRGALAVQFLAPDVRLQETNEVTRFGVEAVPVVLGPGVVVRSAESVSYFAPAVYNPEHARYIARSEKAKPMAINMYSAWWSLVVCLLVTIGVSLVTKPKTDEELKDLVMGLTEVPTQGGVPLYRRPSVWATVVGIALVGVNILFW